MRDEIGSKSGSFRAACAGYATARTSGSASHKALRIAAIVERHVGKSLQRRADHIGRGGDPEIPAVTFERQDVRLEGRDRVEVGSFRAACAGYATARTSGSASHKALRIAAIVERHVGKSLQRRADHIGRGGDPEIPAVTFERQDVRLEGRDRVEVGKLPRRMRRIRYCKDQRKRQS